MDSCQEGKCRKNSGGFRRRQVMYCAICGREIYEGEPVRFADPYYCGRAMCGACYGERYDPWDAAGAAYDDWRDER